LEEIKSPDSKAYVPKYFIANVYNGLEDKEEALSYLEKSLEEREAQMTFIKIDTRWDWLRSEPRFIDLMRRMNFQ
jgi:serine/threonine-protein kinase